VTVGATTEDRRHHPTPLRERSWATHGEPHRLPILLADPSSQEGAAVCVITRFQLRHPWDLVRTYLEYRRVARDARAAVGDSLIHTVFLVESLTTCYSLSIWRDEAAIGWFGTRVPRHVAAAGRIFRRLARADDGNPELWATQWRLIRLSNNRTWRHSSLDELVSEKRIRQGVASRG
jgi:hypothetical protein